MNQSARLRIALVIFFAAILIGIVGMPYLLDWRNGVAFGRIARGDQESLVIQYMGNPDAKGACGTLLQWDQESLGANDGRCVREARYKGKHGSWVVGYSADARVISKHFEAPGQSPGEAPAGG